MSAGTLTLTNNSAAVSGAGTAFNTELAAGDFIVVTVGGVPYTLPVKSIESATALTLVSVYTGPTQAGAAWSAVPRVAMNLVTAALVTQSAEALRGLNYDKQNWQQVFSGTGTITVKLPDGTTYTGPAWNGITTSLANKADKNDLDEYAKKGANTDITAISGLTTALSISQGGTGLKNPFGTANNTFCQGNDERLSSLEGKSGGKITSGVSVNGDITIQKTGGTFSNSLVMTSADGRGSYTRHSVWDTSTKRDITTISSLTPAGVSMLNVEGGYFCRPGITGSVTTYGYNFNWTGSLQAWIDGSRVGDIQLVNTSDKLLKFQIKYQDKLGDQESALARVLKWRVATFRYLARGIISESGTKLGFIANDLVEVSPRCVDGKGLKPGYDPNDPQDAYSLDTTAQIAELTQAVQALAQQNMQLRADIEELKLAIKKNE